MNDTGVLIDEYSRSILAYTCGYDMGTPEDKLIEKLQRLFTEYAFYCHKLREAPKAHKHKYIARIYEKMSEITGFILDNYEHA